MTVVKSASFKKETDQNWIFNTATLILNMEENTQHFLYIMLYYFNKGKNGTEMQNKICAVYWEGAVTDWTCQKWFVKFLGTIDILAK